MHLRCPHCQSPIELIEEDTVEELTCPSCGSQLKLAEIGETRTYAVPDLKVIAHFELLNHVGQGHFGDVWLARDTQLDRVRKTGYDFLHEPPARIAAKH